MSDVLKQVLAANNAYSQNFGDKSKLALPPSRRFAVLTCMDARLDPAKYAGLSEGDAHVIRNAGGRVVTLGASDTTARRSDVPRIFGHAPARPLRRCRPPDRHLRQ